jgi:DNA-binding transcriptional LysR family regulator
LIDKLEFLLALAREKHFGRAAEACGVTQPTLSAGIKQLEDSMGVLLVNRGSRFHDLTPEGERVLDWARRIVGDTRNMRQEIQSLRHGLTGRLRLAAIPRRLRWLRRLRRRSASGIRTCSSPSGRARRRTCWRCWKISKSTRASPISTTNRSGG